MMNPDMVNGMFEALGAVLIFNNCIKLLNDKHTAGVSIISTAFFSGWGVWNLFYYPHLDQYLSFFGGVMIVIANTLWVGLMVYYKYFYETRQADNS